MEQYRELYRRSLDEPEAFWREITDGFEWMKPWTTLVEWKPPFAKWFVDGTTNISVNCLDRHVAAGRGDRVAYYWEGEPGDTRVITYAELLRDVQRFANALRGLGLKRGERVLLYMPMVPELPVAMLACARLGLVHSVVFGGFSADAIRDRVNDAGASLVITADGGWRRGRVIPLKANVDAALADGACPSVGNVIVLRRCANDIAWVDGRDVWWDDAIAGQSDECPAAELPAEHPLYILYTSGTTGKPKGVVHTTAGYMVYTAATAKLIFDLRDDDIYWCTADIGWVTGAQLHRLRHPRQWRDQRDLRRRAQRTERGSLLGHRREVRRHGAVYGSHGHSDVRALGRRAPQRARSHQPAAARDRRRADQPRCVAVVSPSHRRRALPHRGYLVADGDRRHPHHAAAGRHSAKAWLGHAAVPRNRAGNRRRARGVAARRHSRAPGAESPLAGDAARHLQGWLGHSRDTRASTATPSVSWSSIGPSSPGAI